MNSPSSTISPSLPQWVRTDEWADVASSLERLGMSLQLVQGAPQEWKWAIIACHSALQGSLVCVLSGTNKLGCLTDKSKRELLEWYEISRTNPDAEYPEQRVAALPTLLERSYKADYMSEFDGLAMPFDSQTDEDIRSLNSLRNQFTHFHPASWSIEITGLPRLVHTAVKFSQRLMFGHPACAMRLDNTQIEVLSARFQAASDCLVNHGLERLPLLISAQNQLHKLDG